MRMNELLDLAQRIGLTSIVLCVFIRQHDETFMVVDSS
jgi:hypothetical protein